LSQAPPKRHLIVNADDFGLSSGVNRGIVAGHRHGIVTSASLMVRGTAASEAAALARDHAGLSVGLHLDLGEWALRQGHWSPDYQVVPLEDADAVRKEVSRQVLVFRRLLGRDPTHIDSHQHVHLDEPVRSAVLEWGRELEVPVRGLSQRVRLCGDFYARDASGSLFREGIGLVHLLKLLMRLPPGVTELECHPGERDDLDDDYSEERERELEVLCDPFVREFVELAGIRLCSFSSLPPSGADSPEEPSEPSLSPVEPERSSP
jgi:predicted glycoside hydrolase/deacetylase ChbG (UPF0249 family)